CCEPCGPTSATGRSSASLNARTWSVGSKLAGPLTMLSVLMTLMVSALAFAQADVAGNWRVEFVVPTGEMATNMTINQKGTTLSGRGVNEEGEFPLEGKIVDDQITVEWTVPEQGQPMKIVVRGKVSGDEIEGTARLGNVGEGSLYARRVSRNP